MAKISARGAKAVATVRAYLPGSNYLYVFTITSDGRILRRVKGLEGYKLVARIHHPAEPSYERLQAYVLRHGFRQAT